MASERIHNEYDATRIANALDTLAENIAGYSPESPVTPTDEMKAKLPSQSTGDRIAAAAATIAQNVTSLNKPKQVCYEVTESTALYDHVKDDLLLINGHLYKVTANTITHGVDTIVTSGAGANVTSNTGIGAGEQLTILNVPGGSVHTIDASSVTYGNTTVDAELTELNSNKQPITDNTLQTTAKTVPGAINELNSNMPHVGQAGKYEYNLVFMGWTLPNNRVRGYLYGVNLPDSITSASVDSWASGAYQAAYTQNGTIGLTPSSVSIGLYRQNGLTAFDVSGTCAETVEQYKPIVIQIGHVVMNLT